MMVGGGSLGPWHDRLRTNLSGGACSINDKAVSDVVYGAAKRYADVRLYGTPILLPGRRTPLGGRPGSQGGKLVNW